MFNNYSPNLEHMQQYLKENENNSEGSSVSWWGFPAGMSSVRILPPWDPTGRVALPVYMHPIPFQGKDMKYKKWNWTCLNNTFGKPCQICEGLKGIAAVGVNTADYEANRRQFYFNAIVMHDPTNETPAGTHVCLKAGKTFYDWVISQITNPMIGDITNVENGIDVFVTKEGSGLGTTYTMTLSPNGRTAVPKEYLDKITDLYNLDEIFSGGFDQGQIDEMISSLNNSANAMNANMGSMVNQMAGYQQAQSVQQMAPSQMPQVPPTQNPYPQNGVTPGFAPTMNPGFMNTPQGMPSTPPMQTPPTQQSAPSNTQPTNANVPACFGNYDAGSVNCVVCPHEIDCQKSKK